jgi:hypothetical protein
MPVGAIVSGIGSVAGAIIGGNSNDRAIEASTDAGREANTQALALARETRDQNRVILSPFFESGYAANNQLNSLLGLPTQQFQPQQAQQPQQRFNGFGGAFTGQPFPQTQQQFNDRGGFGGRQFQQQQFSGISNPRVNALLSPSFNTNGAGNIPINANINGLPIGNAQNSITQQPANDINPNSGFDAFRDSSGYQFRLNEGLDAVNSGYAGRGVLQSGAAQRGINDYAQGFASNEFGNYTGLLQNQANRGLGASSALAGVNTSFSDNATNVAQQNALLTTNAAVAGANNNNALINGISSGIGRIAGAL